MPIKRAILNRCRRPPSLGLLRLLHHLARQFCFAAAIAVSAQSRRTRCHNAEGEPFAIMLLVFRMSYSV
jgi:hypothetical protein